MDRGEDQRAAPTRSRRAPAESQSQDAQGTGFEQGPSVHSAGRLRCSVVDSARSELRRARLLGSSLEYVSPPGDLEVRESRSHDRGFELCFQQSTRDSAGPEFDILLGVFGHGSVNEDITDLNAPPGLEHPRHLGEGLMLVRHQVHDAVGDHDIRPSVR